MKRKSLILITVLSMCLLTACGDDDGSDGQFYYTIESNPQNLDPQMAEDAESIMIIRNIYGTLMDIDSRGMTVPGTAKSYSVSEDGKTYTFKLREGLQWYGISSDDECQELTAYDYVFAFRRIYDPCTMSPYVDTFSCIENSMSVYSGELDKFKLGVSASDPYTLIFRLDKPNCDFLKLLAHPASSPCNEKLFLSTQGRYGLSAADTYSCGAFYISDWNFDPYWTDNHITLERIDSNSQVGYITSPMIVNIEITNDRQSYEKTNNISVDGYAIEHMEDYSKDVQKEYRCTEYYSGTTCLFFSESFPATADRAARKALLSSIDIHKLYDCLEEDSKAAAGFIPDSITISNKSYRELFSEMPMNSAGFSDDYWKEFVSKYPAHDFNSSILLVNDRINSDAVPYNIIADFEEKLDLYFTGIFEDSRAYDQRIADADFEMGIATIYPSYNMAEYCLDEINSLIFVDDEQLDKNNKILASSIDIVSKKDALADAEQYIIENSYVLPIAYEKEYFLCRENVSDLWFDPFTDAVFFKYAKQH